MEEKDFTCKKEIYIRKKKLFLQKGIQLDIDCERMESDYTSLLFFVDPYDFYREALFIRTRSGIVPSVMWMKCISNLPAQFIPHAIHGTIGREAHRHVLELHVGHYCKAEITLLARIHRSLSSQMISKEEKYTRDKNLIILKIRTEVNVAQKKSHFTTKSAGTPGA